MTEPAIGAGPAGTSWRVANLVLVALVLLLIVTSVLLFTKGAAATPGDSRAEKLSREYAQVTKAAKEQTLAFLTVNYKDMDPLIAKVLAVGIGDIDDSDAVVFVAADSQVTNKSTKGKAQPRYYRLQVSMTHTGGKWLTSNLQFVG